MSPNNPRAERRRLTLRPESPGIRSELYDIIFEAETPAGRWFDISLLIAILASITIVSLETVPGYAQRPRLITFFEVTEWVLTILFTIEYVLRLFCVRHPFRYAFSFWGIIDLLSILPSYVTYFVGTSSRSFVILRSIRLLRVFRVLKLWRMMNEADQLASAIWRVRDKIIVFVAVVLVAVTISGTLMYHIETFSQDGVDQSPQDLAIVLNMEPLAIEKIIDLSDYVVLDPGKTELQLHQLLTLDEYLQAQTKYGDSEFTADIGPDAIGKLLDTVDLDEMVDKIEDKIDTARTEQDSDLWQERLETVDAIREIKNRPESQFTSIPQAMYWAIVTMTTVGYGDVVPKTAAGKMISAILILLGYSLIIVPSTFVSAEFIQQHQATPGKESTCHNCEAPGQREEATYCYRCGHRLQG
ncbi:MAG: ion transporter [Rubripirellula sp.]